MAAAERGRKVNVRAGTIFEVGAHDFTKFSIIPSVTLLVDIPDDIQDSWYSVPRIVVGHLFDMPLNCHVFWVVVMSIASLCCSCTAMGDPTIDLSMFLYKYLCNFQEVRPRLPLQWKNRPFTFLEESSGVCHVHTPSWFAVCWIDAGEWRCQL